MTKKAKKVSRRQKAPEPERVVAYATVTRFDGGAVEYRYLFQPADAARITDQSIHALIHEERQPK